MSEKKAQPSEIDLNGANDGDGESAAPTAASDDAPTPGASTDAPPEPPALTAPTPEERITALEAEKAELRDRMLRIAADFDNWKKRSRKEREDGEARAKESVLRDFLEIADNLERAAASFSDSKDNESKSIRDGVDLVLRQFRSKLERYQVKPIESVGQAFDPRLHEAISQVPSPDAKPGSIVHELQKGYLVGDRLLRPAMVVVASAPLPPPGNSGGSRDQGED